MSCVSSTKGSMINLAFLCMVSLAQAILSGAQSSPQDFLQLHNEARRAVGVRPLQWDATLEAFAQNYAQQRFGDCALIHSGGPYGENIYVGYGEGFTDAAAAMKYWVDEKNYYNYDSNTCAIGRECLHYTQIVWRNTHRVGCGRSPCSDGSSVFITCNYDPPGNVAGQRPY
ncbi:pathogenesis-related protein PRB1-2-like [Malania oleifera]|uniref:pathogenesis-related protein PRB1-2-like n=1 Tax=Malania oleifera TaxID=397392 RepID=UPI0025ADE6E2|nr:pathogenesis-related protein PRB1-2-like [Malania oleifera]